MQFVWNSGASNALRLLQEAAVHAVIQRTFNSRRHRIANQRGAIAHADPAALAWNGLGNDGAEEGQAVRRVLRTEQERLGTAGAQAEGADKLLIRVLKLV